MADFRIQFEWEDAPKVRAPELDSTWARLEIRCGSEAITKVEVTRAESIRTGIYVPLYPIAEWAIANWWFLWDEWRTDAHDSRHRLLAAREGFALPDLSFRPTETQIELIWRPVSACAAGVSFLLGGSTILAKSLVREEFRRLVNAVIERLEIKRVHGSYLVQEWQAIQDAEQDPEQKTFCERAARLGCDPFDIEDSVADEIEHLGVWLPEPVIEDFCDAIPLGQIASGAQVVKSFVDSARLVASEQGKWREFREKLRMLGSGIPWRDGYSEARAARSYLGLTSTEIEALLVGRESGPPVAAGLYEYLKRELGSFEIRQFDAPSRIDAISAPSRTDAPVFGLRSHLREEQDRFSLCRALADYLASDQPSLVTRSRTEHQQRNRAFAAEFLAPAESIRKRIGEDPVGEEDLEELAREFQVSDLVIRHQIQNHNLARLSA